VPLDAGVLEEYRTSAPGALAFSADGETIGVADEAGAVAWERATGRPHTSPARALAAAPRTRRWQKDRASTWGMLVFASEERRVAVAISEDENMGDSWEIGPDLVLVDLLHYELVHQLALVDLARERVAWLAPGHGRAVARMPGGDAIAVGTDTGIAVLDLETGEERVAWSARGVSDLAVAPGGLIASRSSGVIRVWDPAIASAHPCALTGLGGWTPAQFSPDGARLLTGGLLCDGRTGALVASLPVNSPDSWLEGSPPRHCQRLTNTVFAEIIPFHLTLWDARDGAQLLRDDQRRARDRDVVAFAPTGRYHAIAREDGALEVRRLRGGEVMYSQRVADIAALGFSLDGERLWWQTESGERWVLDALSTAAPAARPLRDDEPTPAEPEPHRFAIHDGLLVAGSAAIPCDDAEAVASRDRRYFASPTSHHALEGR
jgi:hypothetical protein